MKCRFRGAGGDPKVRKQKKGKSKNKKRKENSCQSRKATKAKSRKTKTRKATKAAKAEKQQKQKSNKSRKAAKAESEKNENKKKLHIVQSILRATLQQLPHVQKLEDCDLRLKPLTNSQIGPRLTNKQTREGQNILVTLLLSLFNAGADTAKTMPKYHL